MSCKTCKYWQGTKYSTTADCNRVIGSLVPNLTKCKYRDKDKKCEVKLELPFDPHDFNHWYIRSEDFRRRVDVCKKLPNGVTSETVKKVTYYKTDAEFKCEYWEEK